MATSNVPSSSSTGPVPPLAGDAPGGEPNVQGEGEDVPQKRKATSFKITNVFLSRPPSNDGDDSCEDGEELEDSHTEDLSDITDANSFNSLSSKLESLEFVNNPVIVNGGILQSSSTSQSNGPGGGQVSGSSKPPAVPGKNKASPGQQPAAVPPATVPSAVVSSAAVPSTSAQPTTVQSSKDSSTASRKQNVTEQRRPSIEKAWEPSHYAHPYAHPGFGYVTFETVPGGGQTYPVSYVDNATGYIPVAGTMAVINNVVSGGVSEVPVSSQVVVGPHDFRLRFKIVKVETTEPLKRGRWTCLDFNDKPAVKEREEKVIISDKAITPVVAGKTGTTPAATNPERGMSRPSSTAPKDDGAPRRHSEVQGPERERREREGEKLGGGRVPGQTEPLPPIVPITEGGGEKSTEPGQSVRMGSVPPEERRGGSVAQQTQSPFPPGYVPSSTSPSTLSMAGSTTPHSTSVQSPSGPLGMPDFPQATLGQVVRLPGGQLAQVSLTPLTTSAGAANQGGLGTQPVQPSQSQFAPQQPTVVLKPIQSKQQQQQQVVVNAVGQTILVQPQQQLQQQQATPTSQNVTATSQSTQGRTPAAAPQRQQQSQPQPPSSVQQPPQSGSGQQQPQQSQQQPSSVQQPQQLPAIIKQQPPVGQQPQAQQQQTPKQFSPSGATPSTTQTPMQQTVIPSSSGAVPSQNAQPAPGPQSTPQPAPSNVATIQRAGGVAAASSRVVAPVSSGPQTSVNLSQPPQNAPPSQGGGVAVVSVSNPGVVPPPSQQKYTSSHSSSSSHALYPVYPTHPVYSGGVTPGAPVVNHEPQYGLVAEGLVERLEDLVSKDEDGKEGQWGGELEHESASGAGQGSIDNRIEQAMDLVKSHLMSAVRSEVEELRDKISKLEDSVTILTRENEVLRSHVNPEVLSQLTQGRTLMGPPILNSLPAPEPAHPSLQPPQH